MEVSTGTLRKVIRIHWEVSWKEPKGRVEGFPFQSCVMISGAAEPEAVGRPEGPASLLESHSGKENQIAVCVSSIFDIVQCRRNCR